MSEAYQKPNRQNPEGYSPKEKPEILKMAEIAKNNRSEFLPISDFKGDNGIYELPPARFIGIRHHHMPGTDGRKQFKAFINTTFKSEKWIDAVLNLPNIIPGEPSDFTCEYVRETDSFSFIVGVFSPAGTPVLQGLEYRDVPETLVWISKKAGGNKKIPDDYEENFGAPGFPWQAFLRANTYAVLPIKRKPLEIKPEGYSPKERPEILNLAEDARQIEKPVQTITYKSVDFEIVSRFDVIWVGCVDYAANNTDESNISETLKRFQGLVETTPIKEKMNPDWSAALSINYNCSDKPCGIMFANESYTDRQDERYDIFTQPGGLWLRVKGDGKNAKALLGKDKAQLYEFFEPLRNAAKENGYTQNPDVPVEVEYHCHAEYNTPPHTCYAYIPVIESPEGYSPKQRPEILSLAEQVQSGSQQLPPEFILRPKDRIASFSGEKWPYSNVEPAVYAALGLFYGRTERRDDSGALVNDDVEYAVHNVLSGHAFGLFYCLPDDSLSMAAYGFSSSHPDIRGSSEAEITAMIKTQICSGNAVYIDEGNGQFDYLIWGYKDNGNKLLGYKFEHGNDGLNCSFDFDNPIDFDYLPKSFSDPALYQKNGEKAGGMTFICPKGDRPDRDMIYRQALAEGVRMFKQTEPAPEMDFNKVHYGYGQAIYDEWIRQIKQADADDREQFFDTFPIFPHFLALYENRLQLLRFLKHWNERLNSEELKKVLSLCEKLHQITGDAATVSVPVNWNRLKDAPNHEKRVFVVERLKECQALELEIANALSVFLEKTKE